MRKWQQSTSYRIEVCHPQNLVTWNVTRLHHVSRDWFSLDSFLSSCSTLPMSSMPVDATNIHYAGGKISQIASWILLDGLDYESHISSCSDMIGHIASCAGSCTWTRYVGSAGRKSYRLVDSLHLKAEWIDRETFSLVGLSKRLVTVCS